jgi:hypothetical protein
MATSAGKRGVLYLGAVTAVPIAETISEDLNLATDYLDASVQGITFKRNVPGLKDFKMSISKLYDGAYYTMTDAAINDTVLKMYWYPSRDELTVYWYDTATYVSLDSITSDVGAMNTESWSLVNAGTPGFIHP